MADRIAPQMLSLAAAHGLTPSVWQTWYPRLVRTPRVLVPIELEVLMVRNAQQRWADCGMKTPPQANEAGGVPPVDAADLMPPPFAELAKSRPRGAYLQWYLPKGLTSGTAEAESNSANFPPIPDRWLVLRVSAGRTRFRRAVTGWVLEAGVEPPVVTPLASWTEPGPATGMENPLTALGHGDLAWAGYFDNVTGRLGFYDADVDNETVRGPLAYLVCGWYADPAVDPLGSAKVTSLTAFNAAMQALSWQLDAGELAEVTIKRRGYLNVVRALGLEVLTPGADAEYVTTGNWWPNATVLHGAVVGIDWPGSSDTVEVGGPPDPATVVISAGDTMAEALASLIVKANGTPAEAPIVEALQLGALAELEQPDGRAVLDAQLHASSFASLPGGPATMEPVTVAPSGPPPQAATATPGPGVFSNQLAAAGPHLPRFTGAGPIFSTGGLRAPGQLTVVEGHPPVALSERFVTGGLQTIISLLGTGAEVPPTDPGGEFDALRTVPRFYTPKDPILLVQGGKRAFTHDSSVKTENGMVICRLTPISELTWTMPDLVDRFRIGGDDLLETGIGNGSVPVECEGLLREVMILDPGAAPAIATNAAQRAGGAFDIATAVQRVTVEQTAWYALRNPRIDPGPLLARSGIAGILPAAFAIAPASRPWTPLHLDWQVEYLASPNGEDDWTLGELDFILNDKATIPSAGTGAMFTGRATLTGGASATLASAGQKALNDATRIAGTGQVPVARHEAFFSNLAQTLSLRFQGLSLALTQAAAGGDGAPDPSLLNDIGNALAQMDVLSCGLDGLLTQLRAGIAPDGTSTAPGGTEPLGFLALRAGFLRLVRLRLVDGFGQFVDLCGSDATHAAQGYLVSDPMSVPAQPLLLALPPRFTAPVRAWFRYMSADQPGVEADYQTSPVCGFLMPNHLDGALEFFNADGSGAGELAPDERGQVRWEGAPGLSTTAGQDPAAGLRNAYMAGLAGSLINWGVADAGQPHEPALAALLRTIDSTLWSVDPFGHQGDEHLSLLVGHPVCVVRALLRLDVADPVVTPDGMLAKAPVRLGNLTHWQDGLLGYFVDDDYATLYSADAAAAGMARPVGPGAGFLGPINQVPNLYTTFADDVAGNVTSATVTPGATPVVHPYVDTSGLLWIRPNQTIALTLLVEPMTVVHATMGRVPRKDIGMRRAWVTAGLATIAPTFRFGPVLVDPKQIRMPLATDLTGNWVWDYRADAVAWQEGAVTNATEDALLGSDPPEASEGWLKLVPPPPGSGTT